MSPSTPKGTSTKLADIAWTALMGRKDHASDARAILLIGMAVRIVCELCVLAPDFKSLNKLKEELGLAPKESMNDDPKVNISLPRPFGNTANDLE